MNAKKITLREIFDHNQQLVVPLFQRPYVWNEEKNWLPLWESLEEVTQRRLEGRSTSHFLGAVVLDQVRTSTGDVHTRQLIDGQQRLTTFQIVLAVLRDLSQARGYENIAEAFHELITNRVPVSDDPNDVYKVWPTNSDRDHFCAALNCKGPSQLRSMYKMKKRAKTKKDLSLLVEAYLYFYGTIDEWIDSHSDVTPTDCLKALRNAIKDDMQVVVIDLDDDDDAQVIFETLNALGTPLLPADLIKNFLFQAPELKDQRMEAAYERYWKMFDDDSDFWRVEVTQGRIKRPMVDFFLQHYLTLVKGDEVPSTHLFAEFRDLARKRKDLGAEDHLKSINNYGTIFRSFMTGFSADSPEGRFFRRLDELDTKTVYPVLLEVFKRTGGEPSDEVRSVLLDLESFLIRRMVCGLTTRAYNTLMRSLIQKLMIDDRPFEQTIRSVLLSNEAESSRWPKDDEFEKAWLERPLYKSLSRARCRLVLEALELAMYDGKTERVTIDSKLTIEHILPQEWEANWPLTLDSEQDDPKEKRELLLNTIGNLTLVTDKLNPAMSNGTWANKKIALEDHSRLAMNRKIVKLDDWHDLAIEERSKSLFQMAREIWPRPNH